MRICEKAHQWGGGGVWEVQHVIIDASMEFLGAMKINNVLHKEDIKEQPTSRNLSATATRVLQCTCPVAASRKYFSAIYTSPQHTSHLLLLAI
jgi:hypothetical protein